MRVVLNEIDPLLGAAEDPDTAALARLYAYPETTEGRWLRANMVSTLDGAATGPDGKTGSINNEADHRVFMLLRALCDVVVVGAGTARAEGYSHPRPPRGELAGLRDGRAAAPSLAVVSRSANLPLQLLGPPEDERAGRVLLVTCRAAPAEAVGAVRDALGAENVLVADDDEVDLPGAIAELSRRGMGRMLTEGGPRLLRDLAAAGVLDEICLTVVPQVLGGDHPRILDGGAASGAFLPRLLLEAEGTLLGRWSRT